LVVLPAMHSHCGKSWLVGFDFAVRCIKGAPTKLVGPPKILKKICRATSRSPGDPFARRAGVFAVRGGPFAIRASVFAAGAGPFTVAATIFRRAAGLFTTGGVIFTAAAIVFTLPVNHFTVAADTFTVSAGHLTAAASPLMAAAGLFTLPAGVFRFRRTDYSLFDDGTCWFLLSEKRL
jgi:hypothetical protein